MKLGFGELELTVINLLKQIEPASVKEVQEKLSTEYAYTTVMTICNRLEEKGVLTRTKVGRHYIYRLNTQQKAPPKSLFTRLKNRIFGGHTLDMVSYLIENADDVTDDDLKQLETLIKNMRKP